MHDPLGRSGRSGVASSRLVILAWGSPMSLTDRAAAVAHRVVAECAGVREGQHVLIDGRADSIDYLEALAYECECLGATACVTTQSDQAFCRRLTELDETQLARTSACALAATKAADVVIVVHMEHGVPTLFAGIGPEKFGAARRGRKALMDAQFEAGRRWIGTDHPTPDQAEVFGLTMEEYAGLFWRAIDVDYASLQQRAALICGVLDGAGKVVITSRKGTDLTLRIDGRPLDADTGLLTDAAPFANLPAGEVCLAPLEDSAHGTVVFDVGFWDGEWIEDLVVEFDHGVARGVRARRGLELFNRTLAANTGAASVIGELGIGINHEVTKPCGNMLLDEKILGTIHLAVGENRMMGGVNESSLHWDLLVVGPTVTVDGVTLLADGELKA
jgi:aminopeptidase